MKNVLRGAAATAWLLIAAACPALAQSSPNLSKGQVLTAGQWNSLFAGKQDALGYVPLNVAGGVMTGRLTTAPPGAATAGFNLTPGTVPANPLNQFVVVKADHFATPDVAVPAMIAWLNQLQASLDKAQ